MTYLLEDNTIKDLLKKVTELNRAGEYEEAIRILEKDPSFLSTPLWHYNLGTLYAKVGNYPQARFHILMADITGFSGKELLTNKKIIESKLDISRHEDPNSIVDYLVKYGMLSTQGFLNSISLSFLLCGIYLIWKKTRKRWISFMFITSISTILLSIWIRNWSKLIVMRPVVLHEGPSGIFQTERELPAGVMLVVLEKEDWLEIIYPSRFKGWIKRDETRKLE